MLHFRVEAARGTSAGCGTTGSGNGASGPESGVVEGGCRQFGLRLKRSGTRRAERGANAMLALKGCAMNLRVPDFLEWRTNQAIAA